MRKVLSFIFAMAVNACFAQCPFAVTLQNKGSFCLGSDTLVVSSANNLATINWYNGNTLVGTANAFVTTVSNAVTVAGGNGKGATANQFYSPNSICFDANGNMYVADLFNYRIQKFPPGSTSANNGQTVAGGNGKGNAANQFQPSSVSVDGSGNIFVADNANSRILKFPPNSTSATNGMVVAGGNGQGAAPNQFSNPVSVFVDGGGNLFVVDALNDRIQKFLPGATNGITVAGGNGYGAAPNQFNGPAFVFVDGSGNIYVDDAANNRIQLFTAGNTNGITVAGGNGFGAAPNQLSTPASIWVDGNGSVYVADVNNQRIQKFLAGSNSLTNGKTVAGGYGNGSAANQFSGPVAVCVDVSGNIYVADNGNNRIQKFSQPPATVSTIDSTFLPKTLGTYAAMVTDAAGCSVTTNIINISPSISPAIGITGKEISASPCSAQVLDTIQFTAVSTNGGSNPFYQWQVNGQNVGTNSTVFTAGLALNDIVTCTLISNGVCASPASITSQGYKVAFGRLPFATLANKGSVCLNGDTLVVTSKSSIAQIDWYKNGVLDTVVKISSNLIKIDSTYVPKAVGTYTAVVTDGFGCTITTNAVTLGAIVNPSISITADKTMVCAGNTIVFTATPVNVSTAPLYRWQVNGVAVGTNSPSFASSFLANGDVVTCIVSNAAGCVLTDTSNGVIAVIKPLPTVGPSNTITIFPGGSTVLALPVTGDIATYIWSPPTNLSNNTVLNPVANPTQTTIYTLKAISVDDCAASDSLTVIVSSPLSIPTGFTPNGDGRNDVFYVLGGLAGDKIKDFAVFDRWGKRLFQVQNVLSNNKSFGWDGKYNGEMQQQGSYVYEVTIISASGKEQLYKGSVVLVR